jgi:predicted nucleic acid-binding Zn ribbon protein
MNITPLQSKVIKVSFVERRRIMISVEGFLKYLEILPVLQVVEDSPRRTKYKEERKPKLPSVCALCKKEFNKITQLKYCSKECRVAAAERRRVTNDYSVERNCIVCENPLPYGKATYCSDECYKEQQYANVRNPFSTFGTGERASLIPYEPNVMPTHRVPPEILAQAELYVDCNADRDYGVGGIKEDMDEINQIILEESIGQPSRYRKEIRSPRESGKLYWSVKTIENRRRAEAGLPKLSSMRYSNLEQQLRDHHEGKKKVVSIREKNYQIQKHTKGFATITPMRTKSGKSFSEVMANVRKKNVG